MARRLVTGGERISIPGLAETFYEPTILTEVENRSALGQDEVFGPVLAVMDFDDADDAVELANDSLYGLVGNVHTSNLRAAHTMASRLHVGSVFVNQAAVPYARAPFGGRKQTGFGKDLGSAGIGLNDLRKERGHQHGSTIRAVPLVRQLSHAEFGEETMVYVPGKSSDSLARELGLDIRHQARLERVARWPVEGRDGCRQRRSGAHAPLSGGGRGRPGAWPSHFGSGLPTANVVIGNGSSDILLKAAEVILGNGGEAIIPEPCFSMYQVAVDRAGGEQVMVPGRDYRFDVAGIVAAITPRTRMIFLTNPNNPTGLPLSRADIEYVLEHAHDKVTVILDEAYCEYVDPAEHIDGVDFLKAGTRYWLPEPFPRSTPWPGCGWDMESGPKSSSGKSTACCRPSTREHWDSGPRQPPCRTRNTSSRSREVNADGRNYLTAGIHGHGIARASIGRQPRVDR